MPRFMFLHRGGCEDQAKPSPEEMQQAMQAWADWMEEGTNAGWLPDPGDGLKAHGRVVHADRTVTDGPFAESRELVGGYCMIEAADLEAAVDLAKSMPPAGGAIEIRELAGNAIEQCRQLKSFRPSHRNWSSTSFGMSRPT